MTTEQLKELVERISQTQKLEVIEDRFFDAAQTCVDTFEETGSLPALRVGNVAARCSMQAMRDNQRYHTHGKN
jgi:hypothetical protein